MIRFAENAWNFEQDRRFAVHSSPDLPIPQVLEIGEANGAAYAISERVFGDILEELDADRMRRTLPSLFGALDAMRADRPLGDDRVRPAARRRQRRIRHVARIPALGG